MKNRAAFTLAETAVSFALLGLLVLFLINLFPSALMAQRVTEQRLQAGSLARSLLEQQLDQPFAELPVGLARDLQSTEMAGIAYHPRLVVTALPDSDPRYLRLLQLTVWWEWRGQRREVVRQLARHRLGHQLKP